MFSSIKLTARIWAHRVFGPVYESYTDRVGFFIVLAFPLSLIELIAVMATLLDSDPAVRSMSGTIAVALPVLYFAARTFAVRKFLPVTTWGGKKAADEYFDYYKQMNFIQRGRMARTIVAKDSRARELDAAYRTVSNSLDAARRVEWSSPLVVEELQAASDQVLAASREADHEVRSAMAPAVDAIRSRREKAAQEAAAQAAIDAVTALAKARKALV